VTDELGMSIEFERTKTRLRRAPCVDHPQHYLSRASHECQEKHVLEKVTGSGALSQRAIMPREAEPSLNERAFILEALKEDIRLDGRALDAFRDIEITFGEDHGVADVTLGKTR